MIKLIVAGSRGFDNFPLLEMMILEHYNPSELEIISGNARGADRLGIQFAHKYNCKIKVFPAEWDKYGKSAGMIRNKQMGNYADKAIVFWDNKSKGTKNMIQEMQKQNKECRIIHYKECEYCDVL